MELEELNFQRNIINWYPFKENSSILEIWEGQEIEENEIKYDYVVIIGIGNKSIDEMLDIACKKMKEEGTLLIAIDNNLGLTKFCTEQKQKINGISKKNLEKNLENYGLINKKMYYPMPNYKATNVIFTDKFLPSFETINRSLALYDDNVEIALEEKKCFQTIISEDIELFKCFANSFLVEATKSNLEENNISFISYSNIRKPEYRIRTIIQGMEVYKTNNIPESKEHIENLKQYIDILNSCKINTVDNYNENSIISKYQNTELLLDNIIINKLKDGKTQEVFELINNFRKELEEKLEKTDNSQNCFDKYNIEYKQEDIENLQFVKNGFWDMIFQNCFYIDNNFCFFDQEWYEQNLPIEFIMYRAIKYFHGLSRYIEKNTIYEKININKRQIELFDKLDNKLQEEIRDTKIWEIINKKDIRQMLIKFNNMEQENIHLNAVVTQKTDRITDLEKGMKEAIETIEKQNMKIAELDGTINFIKNSKSWKITKPLRSVKTLIKGNKKE